MHYMLRLSYHSKIIICSFVTSKVPQYNATFMANTPKFLADITYQRFNSYLNIFVLHLILEPDSCEKYAVG